MPAANGAVLVGYLLLLVNCSLTDLNLALRLPYSAFRYSYSSFVHASGVVSAGKLKPKEAYAMLTARSTLRNASRLVESVIAPKSVQVPRACISMGPQQQHGTFYELRTYCVYPHQNAAFLRLTNEKIHLRTAHSELLGYWTVEYGGLNQVFHIWKYDSYSQRAGVRAALSQDPSWIEQYISKAMPMLSSQDNEVTYLVPWSKIQQPPKEGGVFELATFQMRPGGPAVWGPAFEAAVSAHSAVGYGWPIGVFHCEFGPLNRLHVLWWYEGADQRAAARHKAHGDPRVVAAVRESVSYLASQQTKLMFPTPFSPMK